MDNTESQENPPSTTEGAQTKAQGSQSDSLSAILPRAPPVGILPGSPAQRELAALFPQDRALSLGFGRDLLNPMDQLRHLIGSGLLPSVQQDKQQQNAELLRSYALNVKALAPNVEAGQLLRQRLLGIPSAPLLQPPLMEDLQTRLILAQNPALLGSLAALGSHPSTFPSLGAGLPAAVFPPMIDPRRMRGGVIEPFPEKLHRLLLEVEAAGRSDVISFITEGRAFMIHQPETFFREIVPKYFRQSRLSSFKRQLNLYGFELINSGPYRGAYHHENFRRDQPELCRKMRRTAIKVPTKINLAKQRTKEALEKGNGKNGTSDKGEENGRSDKGEENDKSERQASLGVAYASPGETKKL